MEKLRELVNVVTRNKIKAIEIIGYSSDNQTKINQLYEGIKTGAYQNDSEAFEDLYEGDCSKNSYYKLKFSLRERLYNTVFFIDIKNSKYSDIKQTQLYVQKMISLFNLLKAKGATINAISIGEKVIKTAIDYEFVLEVVYLARRLRSHYALVVGNRKKYLYYHELLKKYQKVAEAEATAEGYFYDLASLYIKNKSTKRKIAQLATSYLEDLDTFRIELETSSFYYYKTMISISLQMGLNDYQKTLEICDKSLSRLEEFKVRNTRAFMIISFQKIACCIQLKLYKEGEEVIQKYLKLIPPGIFNWFKVYELHLTLCLHTGAYEKAKEVYDQATKHAKFKKLPEFSREIWKIYQAWIHFLMLAGKIKMPANKRKKFRVGKFLNEVPTFSKDKRGLNIPILIAQIVLLLQKKKYDAILNRVEAIQKYKSRYLDKENNFRSNLFIRMLLHIPKHNFSHHAVTKKTKKLFSRLQEVPLEVANQSHDLEILPYEDTWEIILQELKRVRR